MGTLHEDQYIYLIIPHSILLRIRNVSDIFVEKIKTHILHSVTLKKNHPISEIMWKNIAKPGRLHMTVWCPWIACWIPKSVDILRICNNYCFFISIMVAQTCLSVTLSCLYDYEMLLLVCRLTHDIFASLWQSSVRTPGSD